MKSSILKSITCIFIVMLLPAMSCTTVYHFEEGEQLIYEQSSIFKHPKKENNISVNGRCQEFYFDSLSRKTLTVGDFDTLVKLLDLKNVRWCAISTRGLSSDGNVGFYVAYIVPEKKPKYILGYDLQFIRENSSIMVKNEENEVQYRQFLESYLKINLETIEWIYFNYKSTVLNQYSGRSREEIIEELVNDLYNVKYVYVTRYFVSGNISF